MIYSFANTDQRRTSLIEILQRSGIDFEVSEHDHIVVRVLGRLTPDIEQKIREMGISIPSLKLSHQPEVDSYEQIRSKRELTIIAGPCAVESEEQLATITERLHSLKVRFLRGGAYKPRTKVDSFQGLGVAGLRLLRKFADRYSMKVVTEVMDRSQIDTVAEYADILQVGSRNMFNYTLLTALGSTNLPVLLKRGMSATISEWLSAAEYVTRGGNDKIILCERGIRTFEPEVAHTLDVAAIAIIKLRSEYPVIVDPSHAAGRSDLVLPLARAGVAAGADGVMVEVHPQPAKALSDAAQALDPDQFEMFVTSVRNCFTAGKTT